MSEVSLAQLISIIQDNIQRSYEYVEDIAELSRQDTEQAVTMAVNTLDIELPVSCSVEDKEIDLNDIKNAASSGNAFDISALRLVAPTINPAFTSDLRKEALIKHAQANGPQGFSRQFLTTPTKKTIAARTPQKATKKKTAKKKKVVKKKEKAKDFILTVLDAETIAASNSTNIGRLKISFKATLK